MRHHLLQDRAGLPQPHLLGELAGSRGRGRPLCSAWGPGGRGSPPRGRPGPAALEPLVGSFQGPAKAGTVRTGGLGGGFGPLARCQGYAGRRGVSLRGGSVLRAESVGTPGPKWDTPQLVGSAVFVLAESVAVPRSCSSYVGTPVESRARNFGLELLV